MAAEGAAGGGGEAFPFLKGKAAVFAGCRIDMKDEAWARRPGDMAQVAQDLFFGE